MSGSNVLTATSVGPQVLVSAQLGNADAAVYTAAAGQSVRVTQGSLCNVTAGAVAVNLSIIKSGGAVGSSTHNVISGYSLAAHDTLPLRDYIGDAMLGPGDIIAAYAGAAASVDLVLTGVVNA